MPQSASREIALRQQRDRFIGFAFAGGDLLVETDLDGRVTYVAGAAQTISGRAEDDMVGRLLTELVMPELADLTAEFLDQLVTKGRALPCRIGFDGVGGRWLIVSGHASDERPNVLQLSFRLSLIHI